VAAAFIASPYRLWKLCWATTKPTHKAKRGQQTHKIKKYTMSSIQLSAFPVTAYIQKVFGAPVESPQPLFPHKPYRRVWNEAHPELHTILAAVEYIVKQYADQLTPISPPEVALWLYANGFGKWNVGQTIQPMMSTIKGIKRCKSRFRPAAKPGQKRQKSWATYSYGWAVNVIDQKDADMSIALAKHGVMDRALRVARDMQAKGDDYFTKDSQGE